MLPSAIPLTCSSTSSECTTLLSAPHHGRKQAEEADFISDLPLMSHGQQSSDHMQRDHEEKRLHSDDVDEFQPHSGPVQAEVSEDRESLSASHDVQHPRERPSTERESREEELEEAEVLARLDSHEEDRTDRIVGQGSYEGHGLDQEGGGQQDPQQEPGQPSPARVWTLENAQQTETTPEAHPQTDDAP